MEKIAQEKTPGMSRRKFLTLAGTVAAGLVLGADKLAGGDKKAGKENNSRNESLNKTDKNQKNEDKKNTAENVLSMISYTNIKQLDIKKIPNIFDNLLYYFNQKIITFSDIKKAIIPPIEYAACLFFSDNYARKELPEKVSNIDTDTPFGKKMIEIANTSSEILEERPKFFLIFELYAKYFGEADCDWKKESYLFRNTSFNPVPGKSELSKNHTFAIDLYYPSKMQGEREIGPEICSLKAGIVLGCADDWQGGATESEYQGGGTSPKSGNAIIIFNPKNYELYYYAHLDSVNVKPGDFVNSGQVIGIGGNTGLNARKKGHGNHVHFEIHHYNNEKNTNDYVDVYALAETIEKTKVV
ncbi:MAG: M23 family metallopeptidase [Patescibacteria group bacterium]|nr:M23 family metallopeptidase [Patescibacteria group bacterium]